MAGSNGALVKEVEDKVIQELLPMIENRRKGEPDDPQKIWVILHYSDQLKVSNKTLSDLLDNLSANDDPKVSYTNIYSHLAYLFTESHRQLINF